jgi:hypothetical protein
MQKYVYHVYSCTDPLVHLVHEYMYCQLYGLFFMNTLVLIYGIPIAGG